MLPFADMTKESMTPEVDLSESPTYAFVWGGSLLALALFALFRGSIVEGTLALFASAYCFFVSVPLRRRQVALDQFHRNKENLRIIRVGKNSILPRRCMYCAKETERLAPAFGERGRVGPSAALSAIASVVGTWVVAKQVLEFRLPVCNECRVMRPQARHVDFEAMEMEFYVHKDFAADMGSEYCESSIEENQHYP